MANSIIEGVVEEARLKRSGRGQSIFEAVTFRRTDGTRETVRKLIVAKDIGDLLKAGRSGRFYLHSFIDQKGLHGLRSDGRVLFSFPDNFGKMLCILGLLNLAVLAGLIAADGGVRLLPAIFGPLCTGLWLALRMARSSARAQFAADGAPAPRVQARSTPATSL